MKFIRYLIVVLFVFKFNLSNAKEENLQIKITKNLRCLICQGQSIHDSDSEFANSIKIIVKKKLNGGATEEEIFQVARLSFCEEFIKNLPNKFETLIGENGVRLSGGEKQRLSIARAMLKKSSIILLDEATSSLDTETESKIQEALKVLTKNKTTVVIAHRLSTILNSSNIYVIDSGKVVGSGRHGDLLRKSELYKHFYEQQIQK